MHITRRGLQVTLALLAAATIVTGWTGHAMAGHRSLSDVVVLPGGLDPNAEGGSGEPDVGQSRTTHPRGPIGAEATHIGVDWLRWFGAYLSAHGLWSSR